MIVVVGGPPGSGKTTAAERYAETHGAMLVSGGRLFREMAAERGMDLAAFGAYAEANHEVDRDLDARVLSAVKASEDPGKEVVVDGRIQAHLLPRAGFRPFCVLVTASLDVRAQRIARREGTGEDEARAEILAREASERLRYREIYGIDVDDRSVYALEIDSTDLPPDAIVTRIHEGAAAWAKG